MSASYTCPKCAVTITSATETLLEWDLERHERNSKIHKAAK